MTNFVALLERLTLVAPLGLRFHDAATGERVGDGLSVSIYPANNSARRVEAFANRSGTYVLHHAPGLRDFAHGAGDAEFWQNLPPTQTFVVEVVDRYRRFQPFRFEAELPAPRGLFNWLSPFEPSPPAGSSSSSVPLYSAPARALISGMAVVRADLWNAQTNAPAAWAVVEARLDGQLHARGLSDERGSLALIFPYPKPTDSPFASPLASPPVNKNVPLLEQTWELTLNAGYAPQSTAATKPAPLPDLRATLDQLNAPPAVLWADLSGLEELASVTLKYGQELILKSQDSLTVSPPAPQSVLFITPAGSPP